MSEVELQGKFNLSKRRVGKLERIPELVEKILIWPHFDIIPYWGGILVGRRPISGAIRWMEGRWKCKYAYTCDVWGRAPAMWQKNCLEYSRTIRTSILIGGARSQHSLIFGEGERG